MVRSVRRRPLPAAACSTRKLPPDRSPHHDRGWALKPRREIIVSKDGEQGCLWFNRGRAPAVSSQLVAGIGERRRGEAAPSEASPTLPSLSGKRLLALWNALPGVETRKKVGDRGELINQLWFVGQHGVR